MASFFLFRAILFSGEEFGSVMQAVRTLVRDEKSLSTVIPTMLHQGIGLVSVLFGGRIAGVVLTTDFSTLLRSSTWSRADRMSDPFLSRVRGDR